MTSANAEASLIHRFDGWALVPQERRLVVRGADATIGGRAFAVLCALVGAQGRVVTKAQLIDSAWPGRVVEENNLSVQIVTLRKLLGSAAIVNVSGVGYRLDARPLADDTAVPARGPLLPVAGERAALVGRATDLERVLALLRHSALVSIVGTGGVGKTSLARAVVARLHADATGEARDVHWIDLAPCRRGTPLLPLVLKSLGVTVADAADADDEIARALAGSRALCVFDNCEHVLDEVCTALAPLLASASGLRWLTTSQEPLKLAAESVYRLAPLALPGSADGAALDAEGDGALALFCERARAAGYGEPWAPRALAAAAALCRRLDGLPLAIEIAAARVATLGLHGVGEQIDQRLRMRSGGRGIAARHHTLLDTYAWSFALLSPLEQALFCALEPFADGITLAMAQALRVHVGGAPEPVPSWAVLDALTALIDKSLVQHAAQRTAEPALGEHDDDDDPAPTRLHLLESARDFARVQLDQQGGLAGAQQHHAEALAAWFEPAHAHFAAWRDADWRARYVPERRNVAVALVWACEHGTPALLARLVAALGLVERFMQTESELVRMAVPEALLEQAPPALRALAYDELSEAHHEDGDRERARALSLLALAGHRASGDAAAAFATLARLIRICHRQPGMQAHKQQAWEQLAALDVAQLPLRSRLSFEASVSYLLDRPRSPARLQQLEAAAAAAGFDDLAAICRVNHTDELLVQGRDEEAVAACRALLARGEPLPRRRGLICHNLSLALVRLGRVGEARSEARGLLRATPGNAYLVLDTFALAAARAGRISDAAMLAGCADAIRRQRAVEPDGAEAAIIGETRRRIAEALPAKDGAEWLDLGAQMSADAALALIETL